MVFLLVLHIRNYIGEHFLDPQGAEWLEVENPATAQVYAMLARSREADVHLAVEAASAAFPAWSAAPAKERSEVLLAVAAKIKEHASELARAETDDNGKTLWQSANVDIPRAEANMAFFATEILHTETSAYQTNSQSLNYTLRSPLGVVGCISPWNLPLYLFTWKIAPALAAGNTVVAKPSELTPFTAFLFSQLCADAGMPPGVLNIVHGLGAECGSAIVEHPAVKAISFTGGTTTGRTIASVAAPRFKKLSLELGGKNASIVFDDVHIADVARKVARAAFTNQGEICLCGSRILVQRDIYDQFVQSLIAETKRFTVGDPLEETTKMGALVSKAHMEKVLGYIQLATSEGGRILVGGERHVVKGRCENGYFVQPTLIDSVDAQCRVNQEEIFGPVATIIPFTTAHEAVAIANSTQYGLASSVWTNDITRAHTVAQQLQSGIVWINCWLVRDLRTPFGGVKQSGVGREGGTEALRFFTETKNVCLWM